jgi:hypothetical protein
MAEKSWKVTRVMRRMRIVCFAISLAFAGPAMASQAGPAAKWNPAAPENTQVIPAFSYRTLPPVLNAIGARYVRSGTATAPAFLVTFANGRKATLVLGSCDSEGQGCKALTIASFWTPIANSPPEATARAIETFNQKFAFAKAFIAPDGRPALQRYLTADYGMIRGNLAVNLLVFADQTERFAIDVLRPLEVGKAG